MKTKSRITNSKHAEYAELFEELKSVSLEALAEAPAPTPIIVGSPSTPLGNDVDRSLWFCSVVAGKKSWQQVVVCWQN